MKLKSMLFALLFLSVLAMQSYAANSSSEGVVNDPAQDGTIFFSNVVAGMTVDVLEFNVTWLADDSDGTVPSLTFTDNQLRDLYGFRLERVKTDPGTPAPTALYDIRIATEEVDDGSDIMGGKLGDRSTSAVEIAQPLVDFAVGTPIVNGKWLIVFSGNSVNSAAGTLKLIFTRPKR